MTTTTSPKTLTANTPCRPTCPNCQSRNVELESWNIGWAQQTHTAEWPGVFGQQDENVDESYSMTDGKAECYDCQYRGKVQEFTCDSRPYPFAPGSREAALLNFVAATHARLTGCFDHAQLVTWGPLQQDATADILAAAKRVMRVLGVEPIDSLRGHGQA